MSSVPEITYTQDAASDSGPLNALTTSPYATTSLRYPSDLGATDKSHVMTFYIRTVTKTSTNPSNTTAAPNVTGIGSSAATAIKSGFNNTINKIFPSGNNNGLDTDNSLGTKLLIDNSIKTISGSTSQALNGTTRTGENISLYMPDTLEMSYAQSYTQLAPGNELGGQALANINAAVDAYQKNGGSEGAGKMAALKSALSSAGTAAGNKGVEALGGALGSPDTAKLLNARLFGIKNPMLEMIYSSPQFRVFNFEFLFYPRDKNEALIVQQILEKFRYHQAPEISTASVGFLKPPSLFDIEVSYNGSINPNIPAFKTCILVNMSVNYTRNGFQTYEVAGEEPTLGGTGMSVGTQVTMTFQEMLILTKADFKNT